MKREDQERSTRQEDEKMTEADRAIPEQETGKATGKTSQVFFQIKYRQTDREGVDSERKQAGITKNFFFASFPNREIWDVLYLRKKSV